jgi:hypothetical protein
MQRSWLGDLVLTLSRSATVKQGVSEGMQRSWLGAHAFAFAE